MKNNQFYVTLYYDACKTVLVTADNARQAEEIALRSENSRVNSLDELNCIEVNPDYCNVEAAIQPIQK